MITLTLTPDQIRALKKGAVSREQARAIRDNLNSALRGVRTGGPKISCDCGNRRKCKMREYQRRHRANAAP